MPKSNIYVLGSRPELMLTATDTDGDTFIPELARITITKPDETTITVSGGDMTTDGDSLAYFYEPDQIGWFSWLGWIQDDSGREIAELSGFQVVENTAA